MPSLLAYRKVSTEVHTHQLQLPQPKAQGEHAGHELATLADGRTIVMLADGYELPATQPAEITASIEVLPTPLPTELRDTIRAASPHVQLIDQRMREKIRAHCSLEDEMKYARVGVGHALGAYKASAAELAEIAAFGAHVQAVREWGRAERTQLGL